MGLDDRGLVPRLQVYQSVVNLVIFLMGGPIVHLQGILGIFRVSPVRGPVHSLAS